MKAAISYVRSVGLTGDCMEMGVERGNMSEGGYVRLLVSERVVRDGGSSLGRITQ